MVKEERMNDNVCLCACIRVMFKGMYTCLRCFWFRYNVICYMKVESKVLDVEVVDLYDVKSAYTAFNYVRFFVAVIS